MLPTPNKRVPSNPRYKGVVSRLDTGPNMRKILAQYEGTSGPNARVKKRDEFFMTLKPTTLAKLLEPALEQAESVYNMDSAESIGSVYSQVAANATPSEAGSSAAERISSEDTALDVAHRLAHPAAWRALMSARRPNAHT